MRRVGRVLIVLALLLSPALAPAADDTMTLAADAQAGAVVPPAPPPLTEAALPEPVESNGSLAVRDVRVEATDAGRRVTIALSRAPEELHLERLDGPPRLVIDLDGPLADARLARFALADDLVTAVRVAPRGKSLRVVLDLKAQAKSAVRQEGATLVAELSGAAAAAVPPTAGAEDAVTGTTPVGETPLAAADAPTVDGLLMRVAAGEAKNEAKNDAKPNAAEPTETAANDGAKAAATAGAEPKADAAPLPPVVEPAPVVVAAAPAAESASAPAPPVAPPVEPKSSRPVALEAPVPPPIRTRQRVVDEPAYGGQRISLDLKDADIQNVLRLLADVSGLNIIATDDVKGKVTLHLTDVPWDQVLDLVLRSNQLEQSRDGNVVRISTVTRLREEREALRAAQDAEREVEPLRVRYVRVNYARADDELVDKVKGVLTERGSVTYDERTNTIIVRDIQRGINDADELIRQLDAQSPQVLIEAQIVEATEDFARGLGVQWGFSDVQSVATGNPTGQNFPGSIAVGGGSTGTGTAPPISPGGATGTGVVRPGLPFLADFPVPSGFGSGFGGGTAAALDLALGSLDGSKSLTARLTALEEEGKGKVISRPRVITMNNVAATIQSLTILRVKLPSTGTVINTGTGGVAGGASNATEKINTGITLVVTPQVSQDGFVLMSIFAKSSQPDFTRTVDGIPNEVSREANSNVLVPNGETVVLGGIFRNTQDDREAGLPYLRSIPAFGWMFKRMLRASHREELLVFLTPRIVSSGTARLPSSDKLWEGRRQGG
jgi:type IV pilus assembly protein PilQ